MVVSRERFTIPPPPFLGILKRAAPLLILVMLIAVPLAAGARAYIVTSGSMEPAIGTGALVVTYPAGTVSPGDVITYRAGSATVTHRVMASTPGGLMMKGDNNPKNDLNLVTPDQVIGRVLFSIPLIGYAIAYVRSPVGLMVIAGACIIALVGLPRVRANRE